MGHYLLSVLIELRQYNCLDFFNRIHFLVEIKKKSLIKNFLSLTTV